VVSDGKSLHGDGAARECEGDASAQVESAGTERDVRTRVHNAVLTALSLSRTLETGDVGAARREIAEAAAKALSVQRVGVWMFNEDNSRLRCIELRDSGNPQNGPGLELSASDYPAYFTALAKDRSLAADDAQNDPRTGEFTQSYLKPLGITSMLDAPVRVGGRMVGVVCHEHTGPLRHWTAEEQTFAGSMADFVALTMLAARRREAELIVQQQHAFLRQIIDLNPNLIFAKDRSGRFTLVNQATADFYGTTVDALIGKADAQIHPPSEVAFFRRVDREVIDSATERFIFEEQVTDPAGHVHWLQMMKRPIVDPDGNISQLLGVAVDITDRKLAQERQALMVRELDHRVKNNLLSVQALAEQTARSVKTVDDFVKAFSGRIRSMAVAHEALAQAHWEGAELGELLRRLLEPYETAALKRIKCAGDPVVLTPAMAPPLCMVLHELATNAVKYGSLSSPSGTVDIHWRVSADRLRIHWREHDGPPVKEPQRKGFGTELVHGVTAHQLRGTADIRFHADGLQCIIDVPLQKRDMIAAPA
jgi:PAS domain S-box-containing protein